MKAMIRGLPLAVLGAALLAALGVLAAWWTGSPGAGAQVPPVIVGFDMNPTGNSCPDDGVTNCTLGTIDPCISVADGGSFSIDVFLEALPVADSILCFSYNINWGPPDFLDINTQTHTSTTVNLVAQGGTPLDMSEVVPDTTSPHSVTVADYGDAEYNPPFTHGVLGRYSVTVPTGTAAGVYGLTLGRLTLSRDVPPAGDLCDPTGYPPGPGCVVWDGSFTPQHGLVAVNQACPGQAPVGGIAELPGVSDSSALDYIALALLAAMVLLALTAGAWYTRRRRLR
jgi:hypothetical protein